MVRVTQKLLSKLTKEVLVEGGGKPQQPKCVRDLLVGGIGNPECIVLLVLFFHLFQLFLCCSHFVCLAVCEEGRKRRERDRLFEEDKRERERRRRCLLGMEEDRQEKILVFMREERR